MWGIPALATSHLVRLSFLHLEPEFFVFLIARPIDFDGVSILPRYPQSLPWVGAVVVVLDVWLRARSQGRDRCLCRPRTDHFSRSLKGSRLYAREVAINDARGQGSPIKHGSLELEVEIDEIDARKPGVLPPPPVEARRGKQNQVKLVH